MSKHDIGQEILDGICEVKAYKAGKKALPVHAMKETSPSQLRDVLLKVDELISEFFSGEDSAVLAEAQALIEAASQPNSKCSPSTLPVKNIFASTKNTIIHKNKLYVRFDFVEKYLTPIQLLQMGVDDYAEILARKRNEKINVKNKNG